MCGRCRYVEISFTTATFIAVCFSRSSVIKYDALLATIVSDLIEGSLSSNN